MLDMSLLIGTHSWAGAVEQQTALGRKEGDSPALRLSDESQGALYEAQDPQRLGLNPNPSNIFHLFWTMQRALAGRDAYVYMEIKLRSGRMRRCRFTE